MQIIGHRGAKGLAPENTVAGIQFALRRGIDWVEFDVRATKDGKLVVIHDYTLLRLARRVKRVRDLTLTELQKLTLPMSIPTFEDVMKTIGGKAKVMIELKESRGARDVVEEINRQVAMGRSYDDFIIISLTARPLRTVQKLNPSIHLGYMQIAWPFMFLSLRGLKLHTVGFFGFAAPKFAIRLAKKRGLWTVVYTVNHRSLAKRFERYGADAIITDRPNEFLPLWPTVLGWAFLVLLLFLVGYVVLLNLM